MPTRETEASLAMPIKGHAGFAGMAVLTRLTERCRRVHRRRHE
jgi:hypothetical protein